MSDIHRSLAGAAAPAAADKRFVERLHPSDQALSEKKAKVEWLKVHYETQGCTFTVSEEEAKVISFGFSPCSVSYNSKLLPCLVFI